MSAEFDLINQQGAKITAQRDKIAMLERELTQARDLLQRERALHVKRSDAYWALDEFARAAREVLALPGAAELGLEREDA